MNRKFRLKEVKRSEAFHPVELRGWVEVPLDWLDPQSEKVEIFYRLIPAYGSTPKNSVFPIVVIMNGGPGIPSSFYRALDFNYGEAASGSELDRFKYLLRTHRILLVDQRGTSGMSAPLVMDDPHLDPDAVARYFSSDSVARDHLAVIKAVIPPDEVFFIIAQSYGGMVGMQYLGLPDIRIPKGIVFASAAVPFEDVSSTMLERRNEQLRLNVVLRFAFPDIAKRIALLDAHLAKFGYPRGQFNSLYSWLGKGREGEWELPLSNRIDELLGPSRELADREFKNFSNEFHMLDQILSSINLTPGETDRTVALRTSAAIPFEEGMLDENWIYLYDASEASFPSWMDGMNRNPPAPTVFPSLALIRNTIARTQALFTVAENDAFVPPKTNREAIQKFIVAGHVRIEELPGGHNAVFSEAGYLVFCEWSGKI